ncbi:MAG: DUF3592 domain-containing protein [Alphaproteobacteria bacterium]
MLAEAITYTADAGRTLGEVVDVSRHYGSENGVTYTPTIRYRRGDGRIFEAETHISSSGYDYKIGARVGILYSHDDPTEVRIDSFFSLYGIGLVFAATGAFFIGIVTLVRRKAGGGAVLERVADVLARHMPDAKPDEEFKSPSTDPSQAGHVHKPKPKREPVVRRMR